MEKKKREKKTIKVKFQNECGKLDLSLKGRNVITNALKIMKIFDGCKEKEVEN